jgi:hypothetical protein
MGGRKTGGECEERKKIGELTRTVLLTDSRILGTSHECGAWPEQEAAPLSESTSCNLASGGLLAEKSLTMRRTTWRFTSHLVIGRRS